MSIGVGVGLGVGLTLVAVIVFAVKYALVQKRPSVGDIYGVKDTVGGKGVVGSV